MRFVDNNEFSEFRKRNIIQFQSTFSNLKRSFLEGVDGVVYKPIYDVNAVPRMVSKLPQNKNDLPNIEHIPQVTDTESSSIAGESSYPCLKLLVQTHYTQESAIENFDLGKISQSFASQGRTIGRKSHGRHSNSGPDGDIVVGQR